MKKNNTSNFIAFNRMKNNLMLSLSPSIKNIFLDVKRNGKQLKREIPKKQKKLQTRNYKNNQENNLISLTIFSMAIMMVIIVRNR